MRFGKIKRCLPYLLFLEQGAVTVECLGDEALGVVVLQLQLRQRILQVGLRVLAEADLALTLRDQGPQLLALLLLDVHDALVVMARLLVLVNHTLVTDRRLQIKKINELYPITQLIQWNPSCKASPFAPGAEINTFMLRFT